MAEGSVLVTDIWVLHCCAQDYCIQFSQEQFWGVDCARAGHSEVYASLCEYCALLSISNIFKYERIPEVRPGGLRNVGGGRQYTTRTGDKGRLAGITFALLTPVLFIHNEPPPSARASAKSLYVGCVATSPPKPCCVNC